MNRLEARELVLKWMVAMLNERGLDDIFDWQGDPSDGEYFEQARKWAIKQISNLTHQ